MSRPFMSWQGFTVGAIAAGIAATLVIGLLSGAYNAIAGDGDDDRIETESASKTTESTTTTASTTTESTTTTASTTSESTTTTAPTTTASTTTTIPGEALIPLFVTPAPRCGWANFNGRPWEMDEDINILGETFEGPSCWLGPKSQGHTSSSYVEFELGARFTEAEVSVGVDAGVPAWGDPDVSSAADAEYVYQFLEVAGSSERELHPEVIVNLAQPSTIDLDVTGVARLRVLVTHSSGGTATVTVYDGWVS